VWTDDCSMALCLADSLLLNDFKLNPLDLRWRFLLWVNCGLNNGGRPYSIGLGGNISISFEEFWKNPSLKYAEEGDGFNNGNGSLMRMAPAVTAFVDDKKQAIEVSEEQSRTTHNGKEASECCKLLAEILWELINRDEKKYPNPKEFLLQVCDNFVSNLPTVECLAKGLQEQKELFEQAAKENKKFTKFNKSPELDRNWNWRSKEFTYSETRNKDQPGYIGSYCMDALAMALFLAYHTDSFYEAALWATNMGGDSDTVGAICGQITGAMYGLSR
jgi:ADP-ribosyl-[dinitrogen reductase] hydrolase